MITMALVLIVLAATLSCHLFGMRLFEPTKAKLGASDEARGVISPLISEIRLAKAIRIGNGTKASFAEVVPNQPQAGNALQIYLTTRTNSFIRHKYAAVEGLQLDVEAQDFLRWDRPGRPVARRRSSPGNPQRDVRS
jgi:hypothetical protein